MTISFKKAAILASLSFFGLITHSFAEKYKCLIQMNNYMGEGAYIAISVVDAQGEYQNTLYILGADKKWYKSLKEWHKFYTKSKVNATSGASISGGDRTVKVLDIGPNLLNKGYKIRFESAVEDQKYNAKDAEVDLSTQGVTTKVDGTGYIKSVKLSPVK